MAALACTGEPISWLRLELFAQGATDAAAGSHVESCPACKQCLAEIRGDVVALPPLVIPAKRARIRWWMFAVPALAAAAIALVVLRPREAPERFSNVASIKGGGDLVLGLVRERGGAIRDDVTTFLAGDRWKLEVTCDPGASAWIDLAVVEDGATTADHPLAPARVACGNKVTVPGAFTLTGSKPDRVCVRVAADLAPPRALPAPGQRDVACITVTPER
jgi:hypothetical protein